MIKEIPNRVQFVFFFASFQSEFVKKIKKLDRRKTSIIGDKMITLFEYLYILTCGICNQSYFFISHIYHERFSLGDEVSE